MPRVFDLSGALRAFAANMQKASLDRLSDVCNDLDIFLDGELGASEPPPRSLPDSVRAALREMDAEYRALDKNRTLLAQQFRRIASQTYDAKERAEDKAEAKRPTCRCCQQKLPGTLAEAQRAAKRQAKQAAKR